LVAKIGLPAGKRTRAPGFIRLGGTAADATGEEPLRNASRTNMFSPALKVMRISYGLFWVAMAITTGARAWVCHHVALRVILGMWRAWRRSRHGVALEAGRNAQVGIPSTPAEGGANGAAYGRSGGNGVTAILGGKVR
jgi:hypothetical protein